MTREMEELIQKLAELTEMAFEDVEAELDDLIQRINKETHGGATYKVEGFGTFRELDDELTFTPDEKLATEINYKYAGMEPIEIMAGFAEQEVDEEQQVQQEPSERSQRLQKEQKEEAIDEETPKEVVEEEKIKAESEEKATKDKESQKEATQPKEEKSKVDTEKPKLRKPVKEKKQVKEIPEKEEKELAQKEPVKKKPASKKRKQYAPSTQKDSQTTTWIILSAAAVVIVAVVIWGWSQPKGDDDTSMASQGIPTENISNNQPEEPTMNSDSPTKQNQAVEEKEKSDEQDLDRTTKAKSLPLPDSPALRGDYHAAYGLKGIPSNEGMNGYTLVVFSFGREANASKQADALSAKGYRAVVDFVTLKDSTDRWRVGIGQFESLADAKAAAKSLPEPYKSDYFINRIN